METTRKYAIPEVSCRLILRDGEMTNGWTLFSGPKEAVDAMKQVFGGMDREGFAVVNLDIKYKPLNWQMVSLGGTSQTLVPFPDIFKSTILSNSSRIMVFHNHPSGDVTPSDEDREVTKRIKKAGEIIGIILVDHIIIGAGTDEYYSFEEHGEL